MYSSLLRQRTLAYQTLVVVFTTLLVLKMKYEPSTLRLTSQVFVQDPTVEGDISNNLVISFVNTTCRPDTLRFGLAWSSTVLPAENPILIVRNSAGAIISETTVQVRRGKMWIGAEVFYFGPAAASFELDQSALGSVAFRFAFDNLEFCCAANAVLCYDPCFPGGVVAANGRCTCHPGFSGPNANQTGKLLIVIFLTCSGWNIEADNCNTQCSGDACFNIPAGQGAPSNGPCGPCVQGTSGNWQNPSTGVCYNLTQGVAGTTNGDAVTDFPGEPSCTFCNQ